MENTATDGGITLLLCTAAMFLVLSILFVMILVVINLFNNTKAHCASVTREAVYITESSTFARLYSLQCFGIRTAPEGSTKN